MNDQKTLLDVGADGVAIITINNPPLNLLSNEVMMSLKLRIEEALQRDDVKAIVLVGSRGKFSAGFQLTTFGDRREIKSRRELGFMSIEIVTDTLEAARKPLVAAIEGPSFGGGLELALACHARISTSTAQLGLTELQYGILPGFGGKCDQVTFPLGTQRLPRLVGLPKALEMILMSKRVNGEEARLLRLVDAIVSLDKLLEIARLWALDIYNCRRPWVVSLYRTDRLETLSEARAILRHARIQVQKESPNLIHPLVCIDVIEEGIISGPRSGLWKEAEALQELRQSNTCRSLVHIFFAQRQTLKIPGITDKGLLPRKVNKIAIVGGGVMGSGIAAVLTLQKFHVVLKEENENSLFHAIRRVKENLHRYVITGKMAPEKLERAFTLLEGVLSYDHFKEVDLVIETAPDSLSLKQQIFADLEAYCSQHCIFASNTSIINLNLIGEKSTSGNHIVGAYFFSPFPAVPLLEIVHTEKTTPQVIVDLMDFSTKIRKTPIVVKNSSGFVNRMFCPYFQAALLLVEHGADVYQIDQALTSFGMQFGPFRMIDLFGFGVSLAKIEQYIKSFPERSCRSMLIPIMQEDNHEGEPNCKGFYVYDEQFMASPNPTLMNYVVKARSLCDGIKSKITELSNGDIAEMILFPVLNEACRIIAEGIATKVSDLDVASVVGMHFPAYRGGIIFWLNSLGPNYICSRLEDWSKMYGDFFLPCDYLVEQASRGASLGIQIKQVKSQL